MSNIRGAKFETERFHAVPFFCVQGPTGPEEEHQGARGDPLQLAGQADAERRHRPTTAAISGRSTGPGVAVPGQFCRAGAKLFSRM